jgi:hypothetical protein
MNLRLSEIGYLATCARARPHDEGGGGKRPSARNKKTPLSATYALPPWKSIPSPLTIVSWNDPPPGIIGKTCSTCGTITSSK